MYISATSEFFFHVMQKKMRFDFTVEFFVKRRKNGHANKITN
jgi:hypothetical protein